MENRIAAMRRKKGLSQADLAKLMGLPHQRISEWEQGMKLPRLDTAIQMARLLGCTVEDLWRLEVE